MLVQPHMRITVSSHNFAVSRLSARGRGLCNKFATRFIAWDWKNKKEAKILGELMQEEIEDQLQEPIPLPD